MIFSVYIFQSGKKNAITKIYFFFMIVTVFSLEYDLFTQFWGKKKKKLFMTESCHR